MREKIEKEYDLTMFGLTENQSILYQKGLQVGTRSVTALARSASMHRVLAYNTLQELCKQGLATSVTIGNTGYYTMVPPQVLHDKLAEKVGIFAGLLPQLESLIKQSGDGFKVQTYQGIEGMKTLYDFLLHSSTPMKAFLGADHIDPVFKDYLYEVYLPKRLAKGLRSRAIVSKTDANEYFANQENVPLSETIIIPDPLFDLSTEIVLFDEEKILVACMSTTEMSGLLIQSKNLYTTIEQIFELLWRIYAKKKEV